VQLKVCPDVKENTRFTGPVTAWFVNRKAYKGTLMIAEIISYTLVNLIFKFYLGAKFLRFYFYTVPGH